MTGSPLRSGVGHQGPDKAVIDMIAIVLVVAVSFVAFARNIFIDNAVAFHDEYVYKVSADGSSIRPSSSAGSWCPRCPIASSLRSMGTARTSA